MRRSRRTSSAVAEVIVVNTDLGLEVQPTAAAIDEWQARRAALAVGLRVTGSLGLVAKACQQGLAPAVCPLIGRAAAAGIRYHAEVVRRLLQEIGEVWASGTPLRLVRG
ncbi:MAG: DUF3368 domain-containing protein [Candidatus Latescibacterota bacterium]